MTRERIVLATPLYGVPLSPEARARLESVDGVRLVLTSADGLVHDPVVADRALDEAEVLFRGSMKRAVLDRVVGRAPNLRWIHSASAGIDRVATDLVRSRGLVVTNARGVFSRPIAEYVVMMVLGIARRLPQLLELQRERTWQPLQGRELSSLTIGIVGYGSIGIECARLLAPFGPRLIATRRHPERGAGDVADVEVLPETQVDELLGRADVVIIAAPLTAETRGMIGAAQLKAMDGGSWLINVSRGQLVDEAALRQALERGWIGGAVLDVFQEEPLPQDSPLYTTPHLTITPHTSWASDRVVERSVALFAENLRRYVAGEPLVNEVDLEAGY